MILPLLFFGAFIISFLLPNHYYPWGSYYLEFSAFVALFVAIAAILVKKKPATVPFFYLAFLFFAFIPLVQWGSGLVLFRGDAALFFFYLAAFGLSMIVSFHFTSGTDGERIVGSIGLVLVFVGVVSVWMALIQSLQLSQTLWIHNLPRGARPYANLAQTNNYSSLIWISLFSLYYLFEKKRVGIVGLLIAATFLVAGAAMAQSRTSWVVIFVMLCLALLQLVIFEKKKYGRLALPVLVALLFYFFSVYWVDFVNFFYGEEQKTLRTEIKNIRTEMWWAYIHAIFDSPWFGYGSGQGSVAQVSVANLYPPIGLTQYTHNILLDLIIWNGLPLGILIFTVVGAFWLRLLLCSSESKNFYSICVVSALLVHGLLEYPHAYSYFLLLSGFFMGVSVGAPTGINQRWLSGIVHHSMFAKLTKSFFRPVRFPKSALLGCILVFGVALVLAWRDYRVLEEDHRLLRFEVASIGTLKAEKKAPDVVLFDQLRAFTWVARTEEFVGLAEDETVLLEKVALRYPLPMPLYKLTKLRMVQGRMADAEQALLLIKSLYGEETYNAAKKGLEDSAAAGDVDDADGEGNFNF